MRAKELLNTARIVLGEKELLPKRDNFTAWICLGCLLQICDTLRNQREPTPSVMCTIHSIPTRYQLQSIRHNFLINSFFYTCSDSVKKPPLYGVRLFAGDRDAFGKFRGCRMAHPQGGLVRCRRSRVSPRKRSARWRRTRREISLNQLRAEKRRSLHSLTPFVQSG